MKSKIFPFQDIKSCLIFKDLMDNKVSIPRIETGRGKIYIACRVAEKLAPKKLTIICRASCFAQYQRVLKENNITNVKLKTYEKQSFIVAL